MYVGIWYSVDDRCAVDELHLIFFLVLFIIIIMIIIII